MPSLGQAYCEMPLWSHLWQSTTWQGEKGTQEWAMFQSINVSLFAVLNPLQRGHDASILEFVETPARAAMSKRRPGIS